MALFILSREGEKSGPWGDLLDESFQRNPHLTRLDRAFVSHLVNGVWRWRGRLDWMIDQASSRPLRSISPPVLHILRLGLYQVLYMDRVPESAAVNRAVEQVKAVGSSRAAPFVNALLRNLCRNRGGIGFPHAKEDPVRHLATVHAYPRWLVSRWLEAFGFQETEALLEAQNRIPRLDIRVNPLKGTREELQEELFREGVEAVPIQAVPSGLSLEGMRGRVDRLPSFQEGRFQVQDRAAQAVGFLLAPEPGERILDLCAGVGGKSTHLAELTQDRARVTALDIHHSRLIDLQRSADRLGLQGLMPVNADGVRDLTGLFRARFEAVLVDAPCSGLGVLRRHPDGKWNRSQADIRRLAALQKTLLSRAAGVLRSGGRMLFVTCTITPEENEGVVEAFLHKHKDFCRIRLDQRVPSQMKRFIDHQGFFRTLPHIHDTDGFFGALFFKH